MKSVRHHRCQTDGCDQWAVVWITLEDRNKNVCLSCRDEMCALYGWVMFNW